MSITYEAGAATGDEILIDGYELVVGLDTFRPLSTDTVEEHQIHTERYSVPDAAWDAVARTRANGGRVLAVGTTSVRALESRRLRIGLERDPFLHELWKDFRRYTDTTICNHNFNSGICRADTDFNGTIRSRINSIINEVRNCGFKINSRAKDKTLKLIVYNQPQV